MVKANGSTQPSIRYVLIGKGYQRVKPTTHLYLVSLVLTNVTNTGTLYLSTSLQHILCHRSVFFKLFDNVHVQFFVNYVHKIITRVITNYKYSLEK